VTEKREKIIIPAYYIKNKMSVLNSDMYGGSDFVKANYLQRGVIVGNTITHNIPPFSGNPNYGSKVIFQYQQGSVSAPFASVVKDSLIKISLPAITAVTGTSAYCKGVGLSLFSNVSIRSDGKYITNNLDCSTLWPFLTYVCQYTEFSRIAADLHMFTSDAERAGPIEVYLPLDLIFAWADSTILDFVGATTLAIEIILPPVTSIITTTGSYTYAQPTDIQWIVDREYNRPYVSMLAEQYMKGFQVEDPNNFTQISYPKGISMPDFHFLPVITKAVGASDTSAFLDLSQISNNRIVALFFYLQSNTALATSNYNNYSPISTARMYYSSYPLDGSDDLSFKTYPWFHKQIDAIDNLPNVLQYLIGNNSSGSTNANMVVIDYSDANLSNAGQTRSAINKFVGYTNFKDLLNPRFEMTMATLGGTGGILTCVPIAYRSLAMLGNTPGSCTIQEILN